VDIFHNFVVARNGVVDCTCGRCYVPDDPDDARTHAELHAEFERVSKARNYRPWPYEVRERMKDAARTTLRGAVTDAEVLAGAALLAQAWFDRSLNDAIGRGLGDLHPDLNGYIRLLVDAGQIDGRSHEVLSSVYRRVPRPSGRLDATIWEPGPCQVAPSPTVNATLLQ